MIIILQSMIEEDQGYLMHYSIGNIIPMSGRTREIER